MKSPFRGHIKGALGIVRSSRLRSLSTVTGVVIGVASVIVIVSIGQGIKDQIASQVNAYGKDVVTVKPGVVNAPHSSLFGGLVAGGTQVGASLSDKDLQIVKNTPGVSVAVPLKAVSGTVYGVDNRQYNGLVIATGQKFPDVIKQDVQYGSFFADTDTAKVVIGSGVASQLFDEDVPLGHSLSLRGQDYIVSGILGKMKSAPLSPDIDYNYAILVPLAAANDLSNNSAPTFEILARSSDANKTKSVAEQIQKNLTKEHGGERDILAQTQMDSATSTNHILNLLTLLVSGMAAITLVVGGIGIMNVMLVTVTERMHEIGVRKAVGATNRQILNQFIIESTVLSLIGGIIGVVVALLIDLLLMLITDLSPTVSWQIVVISLVVAIATGVTFGTIPALKAARKDPIDALRNM